MTQSTLSSSVCPLTFASQSVQVWRALRWFDICVSRPSCCSKKQPVSGGEGLGSSCWSSLPCRVWPGRWWRLFTLHSCWARPKWTTCCRRCCSGREPIQHRVGDTATVSHSNIVCIYKYKLYRVYTRVITRGVELGGKVGLITQGPNGGGGPRKAWSKNVVFILFFYF